MHSTHVDFSEMAGSLLTLPEVRARLAATEPLSELTFPTGQQLQFTVPPGWSDGTDEDVTDAVLSTASQQFRLTKKALLEAGAFCGIPRKYQERLPASLLQPQLNYWYQTGWQQQQDSGKKNKEFKVLSLGNPAAGENPTALAMCRGTISPFSNLQLLDISLERIQAKYGPDVPVYSDYKFWHDLESTHLRLIIPGDSRVIDGVSVPGGADDTWSAGIDIRNSLVGLKPPVIRGYLFRWWCTNGSTDQLLSTGKFSRRGAHTEEDVWQWARDAVDGVLGGLEGSFGGVQSLTEVNVAGDVILVLSDLFARFGIPQRERARIIQAMAELDGEITLYSVMQAVTQAANMEGLEPRAVEQLLGLGGHIAHAATLRCEASHPCRRLLPDGYEPPAVPQAEPAAA